MLLLTAAAVPSGPSLHHLRIPAAWGLPRRQLRHIRVKRIRDPRRCAVADAVSQLTMTAPEQATIAVIVCSLNLPIQVTKCCR